jgi:50S ribosomal subunit-associated GTPase HflX
MEAIRESEQPRLKADVDSLKRELERVYQNVKATRSERREPMTPALSAVGMVIRGK